MKTKLRSALGIVFGLALLLALVPGTALAAETLPIAQYVKSEGQASCGTDPESAKYDGKIIMNIPMADVLSNNEGDMKSAADNGYYPHGKDGRNTIAYIEYAVTFPEDVEVGEITTANSVSMINGNKTAYTINGRTINFKFYLNDTNWRTLYNQYAADKANPSAHTVDVTIPYSIQANSLADAQKFAGENITGKGSFEFHPSGSFYSWLKYVYCY